ncbi:MAG: glycosyltransferase family 39 protein [Actinobacteria bacterium]|nr:glycosyltransferase family 39 protein [Actinomycetota bacterium]
MGITTKIKNIISNPYPILLIAIILVGFFLRFYNFPYRYGLGEETVRDAVIGIEGARELQAPLVGAFSSLGPFTFGPLYGYQLILSYLIFPFNYSPWIYLSLISVLYIFIIFKIGELLRGKTFGIILALIAAFSPAQVISATHLTSHNNTNIFAILAIWVFLRILQKGGSYWWGFVLGLALGFGISLHYQMAGLLVLPLFILAARFKKYLYFVSSSLGVFITFIPILFFELNNHWFNTRNMIYYLQYGKNAIYVPNRWLFYVRDFWPNFWADSLGVPVLFSLLIILVFGAIIVWLYKKKELKLPLIFLLIAFIINFIFLRYYWGQRFYGYLNYLRPFVFIFTGYVFLYLYLSKTKIIKYLGILLVILTIIFGIPRNLAQMEKDGFSTKIYEEISILENTYKDKKFNIYGCSNFYRGSYNGKVFSFVFLLDLKNKIDPSGVKIGVKSEDCLVPDVSKHKKVKAQINETQMIDFSSTSENEILKAGWKPVSFKSIYKLNARWWFEEQP